MYWTGELSMRTEMGLGLREEGHRDTYNLYVKESVRMDTGGRVSMYRC